MILCYTCKFTNHFDITALTTPWPPISNIVNTSSSRRSKSSICKTILVYYNSSSEIETLSKTLPQSTLDKSSRQYKFLEKPYRKTVNVNVLKTKTHNRNSSMNALSSTLVDLCQCKLFNTDRCVKSGAAAGQCLSDVQW